MCLNAETFRRLDYTMETIIIGYNHYNTLGLIWSLGKGGHKITLMLYSDKNNYVAKSRYISQVYLISKCDDVIQSLTKIAINMTEKPVVFVSNDVDANLLNEHSLELSKVCYFEGGRDGNIINFYRNKDNQLILASKCGFKIPTTVVVQSPADFTKYIFDFPIFIKANNSINGGKAAMKVCTSICDASDFVSQLPNKYYPIQVQEYITKDYELMIQGCSLYCGSRVICPVANKKQRQYPKLTGAGAWSESVFVIGNPQLESLVEKIAIYMKYIGYTGNFSAEFLCSRDEFYFLEINLRNDGTSWLSTCSGYNLPDLVAKSFVDPLVSIDNDSFVRRNFMNIPCEIGEYIIGTINLRQFLSEIKPQTCYSHYNPSDKKTWWAYFNPFRRIPRIIVMRFLHKFKKLTLWRY